MSVNGDDPPSSSAVASKSGIAGLKPPDKLSFQNSTQESWKLFKQRWSTYSVLSNTDDMPTKVQVALFLHCLDDDALKVYNGFTFTSPESDRTVNEIVDKFDAFAIGSVNVTYERYVFNNRSQLHKESFAQYLSDLRRLLKTCDFCTTCQPTILRDRIVLGIARKET